MKKGCLLCQESHFLLSTNSTHDDLYHPLTYKSHRFKVATFLVIVVLVVVVVVVLSVCEVKIREHRHRVCKFRMEVCLGSMVCIN